jgi:hypothetical protein
MCHLRRLSAERQDFQLPLCLLTPLSSQCLKECSLITLTRTEAKDWMKDSRDSGWSLQGNELVPDYKEAACVEIRIPDTNNSLRPFTREVTTVLDERYSRTSQIIQLTEWTLGTSDFDEVGWKTCELMRRGYGELRSLEVACVHVFRFDEALEGPALLMQIFVNQWSAILTQQPIMFFISIDEEYLKFHLHDTQVAKYVSERLSRWSPQLI